MLIFLLGISNWMSCCVSIFFYFDPCSQICEHLDVMTNVGLFILVIWFIDNKSIGTGNSDQDTCMRDKNKKTSKSWETLRTLNWLSSLESNICQYRWKQLKYTDKVQCHRVVKTFVCSFFVFTTLRCPRPRFFVSVFCHRLSYRVSFVPSVSAYWGWFSFSYFTARIYMYLHGHEKNTEWCRLVYWVNKFCIFMYALSSFSVW